MRQCMDGDNLHRRLKKIIGQVQAIDRMIDEDVPCEEILSQLNMMGKVGVERLWKGGSGRAYQALRPGRNRAWRCGKDH